MLVKYYLIKCINKNPSTILGDKDYIHVKAHVEGKQMIIIASEVNNENAIEKTKEQTQIILNEWIDVENENPEKIINIDGIEENIFQTKIDLNIYGVNNE